eukprot:250153_1
MYLFAQYVEQSTLQSWKQTEQQMTDEFKQSIDAQIQDREKHKDNPRYNSSIASLKHSQKITFPPKLKQWYYDNTVSPQANSLFNDAIFKVNIKQQTLELLMILPEEIPFNSLKMMFLRNDTLHLLCMNNATEQKLQLMQFNGAELVTVLEFGQLQWQFNYATYAQIKDKIILFGVTGTATPNGRGVQYATDIYEINLKTNDIVCYI